MGPCGKPHWGAPCTLNTENIWDGSYHCSCRRAARSCHKQQRAPSCLLRSSLLPKLAFSKLFIPLYLIPIPLAPCEMQTAELKPSTFSHYSSVPWPDTFFRGKKLSLPHLVFLYMPALQRRMQLHGRSARSSLPLFQVC